MKTEPSYIHQQGKTQPIFPHERKNIFINSTSKYSNNIPNLTSINTKSNSQ